MFNFLKIFTESLKLAYFELVNNKLRSFLTLLGITVGIFSIIFIFTAVDFLNDSVEDSFNELGSEVIYVQKWPWSFGGEYPWWEYLKRQQVTYDNFKELDDKLTVAAAIGFTCEYGPVNARYNKQSLSQVYHIGVTNGSKDILNIQMENGRFFSDVEERGANVAIIGSEISDELFGVDTDPTGEYIRVKGKKIKVIGKIKDKDNLLGVMDMREVIITPHEFGRNMYKIDKVNTDQWVGVLAKEGVSVDLLKDEIRGVMRSARKIRPVGEEDFALNRVTMLLDAISSAQNMLKIVGFVLGLFSLLIGGFGVANIMFVSVKERTKYIGVKKAIGAKRSVIMLEFLIEAIFLCILGSIIGLLSVFGLTQLGPNYEFLKELTSEPVFASLAAFGAFVTSLWFLYGKDKESEIKEIAVKTHLKKIFSALLVAGLFVVFMLISVVLAKGLQNTNFVLSFGNIALGIGISVFIGIIAGIVPAWLAAKMDPVKAIRT